MDPLIKTAWVIDLSMYTIPFRWSSTPPAYSLSLTWTSPTSHHIFAWKSLRVPALTQSGRTAPKSGRGSRLRLGLSYRSHIGMLTHSDRFSIPRGVSRQSNHQRLAQQPHTQHYYLCRGWWKHLRSRRCRRALPLYRDLVLIF